MSFTDLLEQIRTSANAEVTVPPTWTQGRASFGGLVAALLYEGMRRQVGQDRLLRSFSISFVGPVAPDVPLRVEPRVLREGRAVSQVQAHGWQGDEVAAAALGSFGAARESRLHVAANPMPEVPAPEECPGSTFVPGKSAEFTRYFDWRWAVGGRPLTGVSDREMGGWIRFAEPQSEISESHLLGLVDAWPPAVLPMLTERAPASTLTWTIDLIHPLPPIAGDEWLFYRAVVDHVRDGYNQAEARLWTRDGALLALSRQTVAIFA